MLVRWNVVCIPQENGHKLKTAKGPVLGLTIKTIAILVLTTILGAAKVDALEITWPSGAAEKLTSVPIDRIIAVKEGAGIVPHSFPKIIAKASNR
jgi:ASPIC and UnbV